jgi:hypothetical protein
MYMDDFARATEDGKDLGVLVTRNIGFTSSNDNIKTYYLEYPNSKTDTIYVDYKYLNQDEAYRDPCLCHYPLKQLKFNGKIAERDTTIKVANVYLFIK